MKACCGSQQIGTVEPDLVRGGQVRNELDSHSLPRRTTQKSVLEVFWLLVATGTNGRQMRVLPLTMGSQVALLG